LDSRNPTHAAEGKRFIYLDVRREITWTQDVRLIQRREKDLFALMSGGKTPGFKNSNSCRGGKKICLP
jgi:hypothetical protein